jgi:hypothetical protein
MESENITRTLYRKNTNPQKIEILDEAKYNTHNLVLF